MITLPKKPRSTNVLSLVDIPMESNIEKRHTKTAAIQLTIFIIFVSTGLFWKYNPKKTPPIINARMTMNQFCSQKPWNIKNKQFDTISGDK